LTLQTFIPASRPKEEDETIPGTEAFMNKEEAKKDFVRLLRRTEIEPTSEWSKILPLIIKNPAFQAVKDPVERKQLFENYLQTLAKEVEEKEKDRRHRVREGFIQMCRRNPEIKHYTRYKTARPILQEETEFKVPKDEDERKELYEEYRIEALRTYEDTERNERDKAKKIFKGVLESLELEPYARWRQSKDLFDRKIKEDGLQEQLLAMNELDYLIVFEDYVKEKEREFNDVRQAEKDNRYRQERKNREAFTVISIIHAHLHQGLLQDLLREGIIIEGAKWKEIFPLFKDDERFLNMLGQAGSTPLELFWDILEQLDTEFRLRRDYISDVLKVSSAATFAQIRTNGLNYRKPPNMTSSSH
jgi:pre-mRNA-processing factor 40